MGDSVDIAVAVVVAVIDCVVVMVYAEIDLLALTCQTEHTDLRDSLAGRNC